MRVFAAKKSHCAKGLLEKVYYHRRILSLWKLSGKRVCLKKIYAIGFTKVFGDHEFLRGSLARVCPQKGSGSKVLVFDCTAGKV